MPDEPQPTAYAQLTGKRRKFVDQYVQHLNGARAAREADYKSPDEAWRLRRDPLIAQAINEQLEALSMPKTEIRARLEKTARFDLDEFVTVSRAERIFWVPALQHQPVLDYATRRGEPVEDLDKYDLMREFSAENVAESMDGQLMIRVATISQDVEIDWAAIKAAGLLGCFRRIKHNRDGSIEYEVKDDMRALELLGKAQRMWVERQELTGAEGEPIKLYAGVNLEDV